MSQCKANNVITKRISYAKGKSDKISQLEGGVSIPEETKPQPPVNEPSRMKIMPPTMLPEKPPPGIPPNLQAPNGVSEGGEKSPQGTKRPREEEASDEEGESMQEEDEGEAMEVSEDED